MWANLWAPESNSGLTLISANWFFTGPSWLLQLCYKGNDFFHCVCGRGKFVALAINYYTFFEVMHTRKKLSSYLLLSIFFDISSLKAWQTIRQRSGLSVRATPRIRATDLKVWIVSKQSHVRNNLQQNSRTLFCSKGSSLPGKYL